MFTRVFSVSGNQVTVYFEDAPVLVSEGMTVAAAVLQAGHADTRTTARDHEPRGPYCQMGVCYECLMDIDGEPNQQACLITVREGMRIKRQNGAPSFDTKGGN